MPLGSLQLQKPPQPSPLSPVGGGGGNFFSDLWSGLKAAGSSLTQNTTNSPLQNNFATYQPPVQQQPLLPGLGGQSFQNFQNSAPKPMQPFQQMQPANTTTPLGSGNTSPVPQYNAAFSGANVSPNQSAQNGSQFGNQNNDPYSQLGSLFGGGKDNPYLKNQVDALTRLAALQSQLAQSQVPSGAEMGLNNQINELTNSIQNTNPQQFLKDNPSLQQGGITEGQLERETAQQTLPMTQALSNLVLSKSVLAQQRQITGNQLGAEATGLSNQANISEQIRQATMFGGLPPEIASMVLQRTLFPSYGVTTDITGRPIAYNQFDPSQAQYLGGGGAGQGIGGNPSGGSIDPNQSSINISGIDLPLERVSDGTPYINAGRLSESQLKIAQLAQAQTGVPVLQAADVSSLHTIEEAQQYLPVFQQVAQQLLSPGLLGRIQGMTTNQLSQLTQTNPQWRQFQTLRAGLIKSVQGIAAGSPGLRVTGGELENAAEALPNSTDNLESAMQAINTFQQLLGVNKQVLLGGSQSGSSSGGDTFSNAAAWR